ncbi:MAG TPA: hypothetical protein VGN57_00920 [Pirellulaceae bacterium]|jgi:hypothetical protein|nr:hypothetical protein [Pirellulaceae bacterium]
MGVFLDSSRSLRCVAVLASAIFVCAATDAAAEEKLARRWVYLQTNLQVKENLVKAEDLLKRAKAAGYNGVVISDFKHNVLDRVPDWYFDHASQFKKLAGELEIEIIPTVASIGYSDGLLVHDLDLAEGIPVREAPFVATNGQAKLASDLVTALPGGGFETHKNHLVPGWSFQDGPGESSFVDSDVKHGGQSSLRWEAPETDGAGGNYRVSRVVKVAPWRQFHASVWIKTEDWKAANEVRLTAIGADGRTLTYSNLGVKPTQDWTRHDVVFNSLANEEIRIYCGTWGGRGGKLWMDDLQLEETAFVNLLRRDGCELTVAGENGAPFEEGRDFERLVDPKMGNVEYPGTYEVWHEPPTLTLTKDSRIRDGERLSVSFSHTALVYDNQVICCLAHPKVFGILEDQIARVQKIYDAKALFLSHDEIRVANWCGSCRKEGRDAGELLAENMRRCVEIVRKVSPDAELCVWSDMFDPHHNATKDFYLVNGDLAGSWKGLPESMSIVNWNHGAAKQSLPFFADRGHRQILSGYYDSDARSIAGWLEQGEGVEGIDGAMYTTWQNDFSGLEAFAEAAWGGK